MTREEASRRIQDLRRKVEKPKYRALGWLETWIYKEDIEALDLAIKALEQEPVYYPPCIDCNKKMDEIRKAYDNMTTKALAQEPCDDTISRKSIKQKLQEHHNFFVNAYGGFSNLPLNDKSRVDEITNCIAMVVNEPSVTPQEPKTGHWIIKDGKEQGYDIGGVKTWYIQIVCSECRFIKTAIEGHTGQYHYCPHCGAKMVEPQESEE